MSDDERNRFFANISGDAQRLSALVGRLMDLARADMARPDRGLSAPIAPLLAKVADALRGPALAVMVDAGDSGPVAIDPAALESVLVILLENAGQAGADRVEIVVSRRGREVHLIITDNGPGIAAADRDRLFEPFFTTRRADGGTGLGLAIARALVEAHRGRLELIETEEGAGSQFRISLPGV